MALGPRFYDMHLTPTPTPRTSVLAWSLAALSLGVSAQDKKPETQPPSPHRAGLPDDLIEAKAGKVEMGIDAKQLFDLAKSLSPKNTVTQGAILRNCLSELGIVTQNVPAFFMGKYPVTNEQYKVFIEQTGHRFPYHWWSEGRKDDFGSKERREAVAKGSSPYDKNIVYWEQNWKTLPWAIPTGTEKHPVVYVAWTDALAFAAWAGMRLPLESEWMYAAQGDGPRKEFMNGNAWDPKWLEAIKLASPKDTRGTKPVGSISQAATGPFGHDDMVANVWEWMFDDQGYDRRAKDFDKEYDKLKKLVEKVEKSDKDPDKKPIDLTVEFKPDHRLIKGGCYISGSAPFQLRIGVRGHAAPVETQPTVGFRVAKAYEPARDMTRSRIRFEYDYAFFGSREPFIADQIGIERYDLDGTMVKGYHAISLVPISDMGVSDKNPETKGKDMAEISREQPLVLGTLLVTEKLAEPALEKGIYTIYYRAKGVPAELTAAIHAGHKELKAAKLLGDKKDKPKEKEKEGDGGEEKPDKKGELDWRKITGKYGVSEEWLVKNGAGKLETIALKDGNYEIPVNRSLFLFKSNDAGGDHKFVGHVDCGEDSPGVRPGYKGAKLSLGKHGGGKETVRFEFAVKHESGRHVPFDLRLVLDTNPDPSKPWRLPGAAEAPAKPAAGAPSAPGNGNTAPAPK